LDIKVLTIDQCQGQEADYVILSLVQKPTRFLDLNRLNVALSRVRKKLYFLADKRDFLAACNDKNWPCSLLGRDLLGLAGDDYDSDYSF
jgi:superfamily I DNA and/or RNA helicase